MTTRQKIDRSREARLWISQVIIPAAGVTAVILGKPETRQKAIDGVNKIVDKVKSKFSKNKKES